MTRIERAPTTTARGHPAGFRPALRQILTVFALGAAGVVGLGAAGRSAAGAQTPTTSPVTVATTTTGATTEDTLQESPFPLPPGSIVLSEPERQQLVALTPDGERVTIARGLENPQGLAVLDDGSILVADFDNGSIIAVGGRYGDRPRRLVAVYQPVDVTVSAEGIVYVATTERIAILDLRSNQLRPIIEEIESPKSVVALDEPFGAGTNARSIAVLDTATGKVFVAGGLGGVQREAAIGLDEPSGLTIGPGPTLYVAEYGANQVTAISPDGVQERFALVPQPSAVDARVLGAGPDEPFELLVTTPDGLISIDPLSGEGTPVPGADEARGIAVVPGVPDFPEPTTTTASPSTTPKPTTSPTSAVVDDSERDGAGPGIIALVGVVGGLAIFGIASVVRATAQRRAAAKRPARERPWLSGPVPIDLDTFCAEARSAVEKAERDLALIDEHLTAAKRRAAAAEERVSLLSASHVVAARIGKHDIPLRSTMASDALEAYRAGELSAGELHARWTALGETEAIQVLLEQGERMTRLQELEAGIAASSPADTPPVGTDLESAVQHAADSQVQAERLELVEAMARQRLADAERRLRQCEGSATTVDGAS